MIHNPWSGVWGVSIHAPAKGATDGKVLPRDDSEVSIHAPAKGATFKGQKPWLWIDSFNPRSREGSDGASALNRAT